MPTHKDVDAWQEYTYHFICEVQENGLPKVLVDDYEGDRIDLFEAIKQI